MPRQSAAGGRSGHAIDLTARGVIVRTSGWQVVAAHRVPVRIVEPARDLRGRVASPTALPAHRDAGGRSRE
jgi:hypothetical protein